MRFALSVVVSMKIAAMVCGESVSLMRPSVTSARVASSLTVRSIAIGPHA